jgi:hypothetical protein
MSITVRRRAAMAALAFGLLATAALAANTALLSPTADGGMPGFIIDDPKWGPVQPEPTIWPGLPTE